MPNHVINVVVLHGVLLDKVGPLLTSDAAKKSIDFATLLPLPINYWAGSVGQEHEEAFPGNHLDAGRTTWGTKWNAYGLSEGGRYESVREENGSTVLTFQTAWAPPRGWIVALFNTLQCAMTHWWLSEGSVDAAREEYFVDERFGGVEWMKTVVLDGSGQHRYLHKLLWGVETFEEEDAK